MLQPIDTEDLSKRDTTHVQAHHLTQLPFEANLGSRSWVHRSLRLRVVELRADRSEVASIIRTRHYLRKWPAPPKTLLMSYFATLGGDGAAALVMVGLLPCNYGQFLPVPTMALRRPPGHAVSVELDTARARRSDRIGIIGAMGGPARASLPAKVAKNLLCFY